eukprot:11654648-Alexandrium_andersonii.AAC.1
MPVPILRRSTIDNMEFAGSENSQTAQGVGRLTPRALGVVRIAVPAQTSSCVLGVPVQMCSGAKCTVSSAQAGA